MHHSLNGEVSHDYTKHVAPRMTPEKKLIYQVIFKLHTHIADLSRRKSNKVYVSTVKDQLTINLKHQVLENSMNYLASTSAHNILESLTSVFENTSEFDTVEEGELEASDLVNVPGAEELASIPEDSPLPVEDFSKKKMHGLFF